MGLILALVELHMLYGDDQGSSVQGVNYPRIIIRVQLSGGNFPRWKLSGGYFSWAQMFGGYLSGGQLSGGQLS